MPKKKLNAHLYMETKVRHTNNGMAIMKNENNYLYANGIYPTKIAPQDLPAWYIRCYIYQRYGYLSAKSVKELLYVPNYTFKNHLHKYDFLYVSYGSKITPHPDSEHNLYTGYDDILSGSSIVTFVGAAELYSGYDVSEILSMMSTKRQWHQVHNLKRRYIKEEPCSDYDIRQWSRPNFPHYQ